VTKAADTPAGYLALTLNVHLPYVVNHGTWPHGLEWLHEAAAETYLPLLRVLANLERDAIPANFNLNLSPVLLEQLTHPHFRAEFPKYLARKIAAAREDEAYFLQSGDSRLVEIARFWNAFYTAAQNDFNALDGDIVARFRRFNDAGQIEILTCAATHGYLPLLGTDESVRAQLRTAVRTHVRHFGKPPRGLWSPECGYRPAGLWSYPVLDDGATQPHPAFRRIGIEQAFAECGLEYFVVDTHLVEDAGRSLYQPYFVDGPYDKSRATTVFPRDPRTGLQVWSSDIGYPGDPNYLDFHKKRFPGGHRYWQVTGADVVSSDKFVYNPQDAANRVQMHAAHFAQLVFKTLQPSFNGRTPPLLCAPFDADLFGHWWFEGTQWLEAVVRAVHAQNATAVNGNGHADGPTDNRTIATITCGEYLNRHSRAAFISMHEGSWGTDGNHQVWMNPDTAWTYAHIYPAERYLSELCSSDKWRNSELARRIVQQLCRELLLLESSDWQSLITTGSARDYAEKRFHAHNDYFLDLKSIFQAVESTGTLTDRQANRLAEIERTDNIFPDLDPDLWAEAPATLARSPQPSSATVSPHGR
jgi:1,4-alpha-glucan branching enzyme